LLALTGLKGFYKGWFPALVQKIPSYALTWMFFQQLKASWYVFMGRAGTTVENTLIGSFAAAGACCVMIPIDTIKTRLVMQDSHHIVYHGMWDCLTQILRHEGVWSLYRALPPRLTAVVPMIGIQFAVYELMKRVLLGAPPPKEEKRRHDEEVKKQELALTQELMKRWRKHRQQHKHHKHHHHHHKKGEHKDKEHKETSKH
jgi:solute carrier family 25 S-adenosylmethionine transporter 26